jgi:hypothetical protein
MTHLRILCIFATTGFDTYLLSADASDKLMDVVGGIPEGVKVERVRAPDIPRAIELAPE